MSLDGGPHTGRREDWLSGTLRARRAAPAFLFESDANFDSVCGSAGLDLNGLRARLLRIGRKVEMNGPCKHSVAA